MDTGLEVDRYRIDKRGPDRSPLRIPGAPVLHMRKITDQAFVVLCWFAGQPDDTVATARAVAEATGIPQPTVAKLLKKLARGDVLVSTRGLCGGYSLARAPERIPLTHVIAACEGPLGLTDCTIPGTPACDDHGTCAVAPHWQVISRAIVSTLEGITLAELTGSPTRLAAAL